jgi:hypothetical protein
MSTFPGPDPRFAIVPIHPYAAEPDGALLTGPMDLLMSTLPDTRARAEAIAAIADAQQQLEAREAEQALVRAANVAILSDGMATCIRSPSPSALTRRTDPCR